MLQLGRELLGCVLEAPAQAYQMFRQTKRGYASESRCWVTAVTEKKLYAVENLNEKR
jgi:hypothetical protein